MVSRPMFRKDSDPPDDVYQLACDLGEPSTPNDIERLEGEYFPHFSIDEKAVYLFSRILARDLYPTELNLALAEKV